MNDESPEADLRVRSKRFALRIIRMAGTLKRRGAEDVLGRQVLRSGTSVGAQYREACRSRSKAEFISKLESALQELEETRYWLELLIEGGIVSPTRLDPLLDETDQLTAILTVSVKTAKRSMLKGGRP